MISLMVTRALAQGDLTYSHSGLTDVIIDTIPLDRVFLP